MAVTIVNGLKNSQKIFLVINDVAWYTTIAGTEKIARDTHRVAVKSVLNQMAQEKVVGMARTVRIYEDLPGVPFGRAKQIPVNVQVSLC